MWIRCGLIVFTLWKDTKFVCVAYTVHSGNSHNQVKRRLKTSTGVVEVMVCIPDATYRICSIRRRSHLVAAYNSMGELNKIVAALE